MGYINKGGSSGGGGGSLPDYSLKPIIYPRKWTIGMPKSFTKGLIKYKRI